MGGNTGILRFLACGSVDDGKSTLIGHLIALTGNLFDDQRRVLEEDSRRAGTTSGLDYSLLLDGLIAEREQGITIDVAYRYFATPRRTFIVADTPGHERYTRNMATGASCCDAALILIDSRTGVLPQTRRHALICGLMGIVNILFVVNKMDAAGWSGDIFDKAAVQCRAITDDLERFGLGRRNIEVIPVSALTGDNLTERSARMPWYGGMTLLEWLEGLPSGGQQSEASLRMPVQYVIRGGLDSEAYQDRNDAERQSDTGTFRAYAGCLTAGTMRVGDDVLLLPSGARTSVTRIWNAGRETLLAASPAAISLTLAGDHDISRGECIVSPRHRPEMASMLKVRLVWMDAAALFAGRRYLYRSSCGTAAAEVTRLRNRIDLGTFHRLAADRLAVNDIGEAELSLARPFPCDPYLENRETGGFILIDTVSNSTVACGMILHPLRRATNVHWQREEIDRAARSAIKGQHPCVVWLTGLSGAGKSTIANSLERQMHERGRHTMLLDGDNVRHGLNRDLGFTETDRVENIRRIGEVAKLMADAGLIVISAFISPYRSERKMVRGLMPAGEFVEVHVNTPLAICEQRDPKGLYRKARSGAIPNFTGVNAPYEEPAEPELRLDTSRMSAEECADTILRYLESLGVIR